MTAIMYFINSLYTSPKHDTSIASTTLRAFVFLNFKKSTTVLRTAFFLKQNEEAKFLNGNALMSKYFFNCYAKE